MTLKQNASRDILKFNSNLFLLEVITAQDDDMENFLLQT